MNNKNLKNHPVVQKAIETIKNHPRFQGTDEFADSNKPEIEVLNHHKPNHVKLKVSVPSNLEVQHHNLELDLSNPNKLTHMGGKYSDHEGLNQHSMPADSKYNVRLREAQMNKPRIEEGWGDDPEEESAKRAIEGILSRHVINHPKGLELIKKHGLPEVLNNIDEVAYHHSRGMAGQGIGTSDSRAFIDSLHANLGEKSPFSENESFSRKTLSEISGGKLGEYIVAARKREKEENKKGQEFVQATKDAGLKGFAPPLRHKGPQAGKASRAEMIKLALGKIENPDFPVSRRVKVPATESAVVNPYAVGMAQAMKSTGDKPPLEKSTIIKAHEIAKKVEEKMEESYEKKENTFFSNIMTKLEEEKKRGRPKKEEAVPPFHEQLNKIIDQGPLGTGKVTFRDGSSHPITREHAMRAVKVMRSWSGPGIKPDDREANMAHISASHKHFMGHIGAGPKVDSKFVRKPGTSETENQWIETKPDDKSWQQKVQQRMQDRTKGK